MGILVKSFLFALAVTCLLVMWTAAAVLIQPSLNVMIASVFAIVFVATAVGLIFVEEL